MKVEAPDDLPGRMVCTQQRAKMISDSLQAIARSELQDPNRDTLYALGAAAAELADELAAIEDAYVFKGGAR